MENPWIIAFRNSASASVVAGGYFRALASDVDNYFDLFFICPDAVSRPDLLSGVDEAL